MSESTIYDVFWVIVAMFGVPLIIYSLFRGMAYNSFSECLNCKKFIVSGDWCSSRCMTDYINRLVTSEGG